MPPTGNIIPDNYPGIRLPAPKGAVLRIPHQGTLLKPPSAPEARNYKLSFKK